MADFDKVILLSPNNSHAYFNRAQLYLQLGKHDLAERDLVKVLSIAPRDSLAQLRLGDS